MCERDREKEGEQRAEAGFYPTGFTDKMHKDRCTYTPMDIQTQRRGQGGSGGGGRVVVEGCGMGAAAKI